MLCLALRTHLATVVILGTSSALAAPPKASYLYPIGAGRGQTAAVKVEGTFDSWPLKPWISQPGLDISLGEKKGELTVRVADNATPGLRWIRFFDEQGATQLLPFEVSVTPSLTEQEPNSSLAQAQRIEALPIVIDARLSERADVDSFAVELSAGQTLVAALKGNRFGSPMDPVLQLVSPEGFVLEQSDDEIGLDPQITFEVSKSGLYALRCFAFPSEPNSTIGFASGDNYIYRLTITTDGFLDHAFPLAVGSDSSAPSLTPFGWNIPPDSPPLTTEASTLSEAVVAWHPDLAQFATLPSVSGPSIIETQANESTIPLALPITVSGRIEHSGEVDTYSFTASKDQACLIRVAARELGSALDPVLQVLDQNDKVVAEQDDAGTADRDVALNFSAPDDGVYRIVIRDLSGQGGLRFFYRLDLAERTRDFSIDLPEDRISASSEKPAEYELTVTRKHGFASPIEITIEGLPPGIEFTPKSIEPEQEKKESSRRRSTDNSASQKLSLTFNSPQDAAAFSGPISIVGVARTDQGILRRAAKSSTTIRGISNDQIWLTVLPDRD